LASRDRCSTQPVTHAMACGSRSPAGLYRPLAERCRALLTACPGSCSPRRTTGASANSDTNSRQENRHASPPIDIRSEPDGARQPRGLRPHSGRMPPQDLSRGRFTADLHARTQKTATVLIEDKWPWDRLDALRAPDLPRRDEGLPSRDPLSSFVASVAVAAAVLQHRAAATHPGPTRLETPVLCGARQRVFSGLSTRMTYQMTYRLVSGRSY
jgi:hypothetical protein